MIRDITEQKLAIRDLHKSERKYKDFFHKTKDMAFCVSPDGVFLDINDAGIELLGLPNRKTALQSNVYSFVEHPATITEIMSELNNKGHISNKYVTLNSKSGRCIEVDITARAKKSDSGDIIYFEGIASNITQALENQRNRVLRNTAAGMCHYLNSHLMQISSAQSGMEEELSEIDEKFINSARLEEKDEIWLSGRNVLSGYVQDINSAYKKISEITRAFNSAFLKYREEAYLDKTILDIFSTYRPEDIS
jgi:PAS domain S-box-containing protein